MDPVHFFKKYAKIQHPIKGKILFELYPFQEDTLRDLRDYRFNIIGKSRQMAISTLVAGYALHNLMFQDVFKALVIATTQEVAKNLVQKVQIMFEFLPSFLKSGLQIVNNNKLSLTFSNGSSILHPGFNQFLLGNEMSLKKLLEQFDQQLEEENVTGGGESYNTPFTFTRKEKRPKDASYSKVPPTTERFFKRIEEIAYKDFKNDQSKNEKQKINDHILEINRKLREVEQMISHAHKLKNESGQDHNVFWKRTQGSFIKIKERLNRLTNKIVEITG